MDDKQIQTIFKTVLDSLKSKLDALDTRGQGFYQNLQAVQQRLNDHIKKTCSDELSWFEKNGKVDDGENGLNLSVHDEVDQAEAEKRLNNFTACARNNDFGLEDFFRRMQIQQQTVEESNTDCIRTCMEKNNKEPKSFQDCITTCFSSTVVDMNKSFDSIEKKVNEVKSRL
jgi:hypothetical protein